MCAFVFCLMLERCIYNSVCYILVIVCGLSRIKYCIYFCSLNGNVCFMNEEHLHRIIFTNDRNKIIYTEWRYIYEWIYQRSIHLHVVLCFQVCWAQVRVSCGDLCLYTKKITFIMFALVFAFCAAHSHRTSQFVVFLAT